MGVVFSLSLPFITLLSLSVSLILNWVVWALVAD